MIRQFINKLRNGSKLEGRKEGTVKFFNRTKGFGFIKVKDSDDEIFVHSTNLIDRIKEGDKVKFNVEKGDKGWSAIAVSLL